MLVRLARIPGAAAQVRARAFATKAEKKAAQFKRDRKGNKKPPKTWEYAKYLRYKPPDTSYADEGSEGWTYIASMAIERTPRLLQFEPSWFQEWSQFQDHLDLHRKKVVPLDWVQTRKSADEDTNRVFHPNPRVTEEDRSNDRQSLHRAMDTSTFLLVKTSKGWHFPEGEWQQSETIRETAEKQAQDLCGKDLDTYLLGNAPVGHLSFEDKKQKWFLLHNLYVGGNVTIDESQIQDFAWVTKYEFEEYFKDPEMLTLLNSVFYCP